MPLLQSHSKWFIKRNFILRYSAVTSGITFSKAFLGLQSMISNTHSGPTLWITIAKQTGHLSHVHKSAWKSTKILNLDLCTLFPHSTVLRNDMHFNLPKATLVFWQHHATLLSSKVNTRTTKAEGVSEFLLGREVVNRNSSKWRVNEETPCCHSYPRPPPCVIQEAFQFVTRSPELSNASHST